MARSNWPISSWIRLAVFGLFLPLFVLALFLYVAMNAASLQAAEIGPADSGPTATAAVDEADAAALLDGWQRSSIGRAYVKPAAAAEVITPTTLSVTILSTPWAVLDSNKPGGTQADPAPRVFMVEARVLNTGDYDAVDLELVLDYNEDPDNDWLLLKGEVPLREPAGNLAPGEEFYGYWFASYPITFSAGHQYTVTAAAELVDPVSTSANFFFEPTPGATVMTDEFLSTGSSGQSQIDTNIVVGVAYTIAVEYNLGSDPGFLIFTPVGNPGFDAGSTRLTGASVRLYNQVDITGTTISDRLFISNVPTMTNDLPPDTAEIVYTMLPVTPASTELCPFMAVGNYIQKPKFDQFYCDPTAEPPTSVIIEGDLSYSMTKSVSSDFVQQDGILTYTINYTNTGEVPLNQIWVWDDLDPAVASVVSGTVSPAPNADESNEHRVAWYLGEIPAPPNPGYTGTLTFQALVDGGGADLADGTDVINHAFFGVNPGSLPPRPAFTATITSTIQAPSIALAKSDGLESVGNGQALTYTVTAANNGSVTASSVVLTDVLPALVDLAGTPSPAPDDVQGQTLVWTSLADLAPGETVTVTIPVTVSQDAASFTQLVNQAYFEYDNDLDYTFDVETASDTTEVARVAGYVEGYAFEDTVPDGTFDGDEPRLSGVQITLPAALTPTVTTDVDGYYRFRIEVEEPISVTAGLPAGFFRTTPGKAFLDSTFDVTKTVNFGYASTSSDFAIIYGTVFADNNHDGNQDLGENGLPGVTISATAAITSPVFSNEFGQYTLGFEDSGAVSVEETNPAGYVSTTPDLVPTNVVTGSNQGSPVNFGDFLGIRIEGKVFDDLNVNGQDDGESGLAGAGVAAGSDSLTTDGSGLYTLFARVTGGPIVITETDPGGYVSTNAITGTAMSRVDANRLRIDSPVSGTVYSDGLFGDVLASSVISITGVVWDDNGAGGGALANGQRDGSEPGLAGVWLSASSGMAAQSLLDGSYTLYAPPGVAVTVTEKNPAGYVSTNAVPGNSAQKIDHDNLRVEGLSAGQSSAGNQFGDVLSNTVAAFSGNVWNDNGANGGVAADGLWQQGQEPTLAGALVSLSSGMNMTTGPDGAYLLYGPPGVPITITELNPAGYVSTGAIPGAGAVRHDDDNLVVASPVANQLYAGNLFGDALPADVAVEKSADPDPVVAGTGLTYTVVVSNHGPSNASGVVVTDTLPAAVDFVSYLASQGTFSNTTGVWTVGDLAVDGSATLTIEVNVNSEATVSLTNSVLASAIQKDINTENNTFTLITGIDGEVDLALSKSAEPTSVVAGTVLTYRLELGNNGPSYASGVTVEDDLPAAVEFVSYEASTGVFSDTTGVWDVGDLALDATAVLTIEVEVSSDAPVSLTNRAEAAADQTDTNPDNNVATAVTDVTRQSDLAIAKSAVPDPVAAGGIVTYTLTYTNLGPSEAQQISVADTLSEDVVFVEVVEENPALDSFVQDGQVLTWTLASLADGGSGTIIFTVQVQPDTLIPVVNEVVIGSQTPDPSDANNHAETTTSVGDPNEATIYGYVFGDLNINGKFDGHESGLDGVKVWLDDTYSTTTTAEGLFFFITDISGTHKVTEVDPDGYFSTTSNRRVLAVALGSSKRVDFGDSDAEDAAAIYGTVFNDEDSSAIWEDDEFGLSGVTVTLVGEDSTQTDLYGGYTFSVTVTGTYTVVQTDLDDYFSTTPNTVEVEVEFGDGYETNFGDVLAVDAVCTIEKDPFEDDDVSGDATTLSFDSWRRHDFCDDAVDWTKFEAKAGSVYTITTDSFDQRTDTYIALYDTDGQTLIAANDDMAGATDFSSQLSFRASANGPYFVRTNNMGGVTGRHTEYDIQVAEKEHMIVFLPAIINSGSTRSAASDKPYRGNVEIVDLVLPDPDGPDRPDGPLGVITHQCPDAYEVDDTWQTAYPVDHGDVQVHSFDSDPVLWAADKDYLGFTLERGQTITFTVKVMTNTVTLLELFDSQGQSLGLTGTTQLVYAAPKGGRFYVSVSPQPGQGYGCSDQVGYEIEVEKSPLWVVYIPFVIKP